MIITLEHDGQPFLDSSSEKKVPLDILLPQQSYYPEGLMHPVLRHINTGYAASISSGYDAHSEITSDFFPTDLGAVPRRKRWRLFNLSRLFEKRPSDDDPLLSGSTMVEKPRRTRRHRSFPLSRTVMSKKWIVGWALLSLLLCALVAFGVWISVKRVYRIVFPQTMNTEWSPDDSSIYTLPPELFGCYSPPSTPILNGTQGLFSVPPGQVGQHTFTIQGGASGHLTLASAPDPNTQAITYDIVIQSNPPSLAQVSFSQPNPGPATTPSTDFLIDTPINMIQTSLTEPPACMRFDITMYIPRNLQQLTVNISTPVQITFSPQGHVELDNLSILITSSHPKCQIDSSDSLQAKSLSIEMNTGLIQGYISIGDSSKITNWNGQILLDTIPNAALDFSNPSTAQLETTCYGKVEIRYLWNRAYRKRPIDSSHTMGIQDTSTGTFDYGDSGFNGLLYLNSTDYNITNGDFWEETPPGTLGNATWPTVIGSRTGEDNIFIRAGSGSIILPDDSDT